MDGGGKSGYLDHPPCFSLLTWHFMVSNAVPT
jgi:hypothetical protein